MTAANAQFEQVNVRLEPLLVQRAREYNALHGHKMQWLISTALREFLDRRERKRTTKLRQ
jgi:hypothetical protein